MLLMQLVWLTLCESYLYQFQLFAGIRAWPLITTSDSSLCLSHSVSHLEPTLYMHPR
jgi:hypothetical protein